MSGAQAMAYGLPNARLHILEDSGHMGFIEQPEEVISTIKDWIGSLSVAPVQPTL
jgi:pimeloyl-ACP methyl ester carboxylesterase